MGSRMFMKIGDKIKGESTDDKHKDWIEILSFGWGVSQPISAQSGTGGRTGGGCQFSDMSFMKVLDASSADIMQHCAMGEHIPKVTVEVCLDSGKKHTYLMYEMENVIVSSFSPSGSDGGDKPTESVSLNFGKFKQTYTPIKHDGSPGTKVTRGWDLEKHVKV